MQTLLVVALGSAVPVRLVLLFGGTRRKRSRLLSGPILGYSCSAMEHGRGRSRIPRGTELQTTVR